jgi:molybdenum cofactor cytidylyltransferase
MEIPARPQMRDPVSGTPPASIAIAVLAAGRSTRMAGTNKLLATFDGVPLLRRSVMAAVEAGGNPVTVVLGHMAGQCRAVLKGLDVVVLHNAAYAEGLSSSLQYVVRQLPSATGGVMIMLADMPALSAGHLRQMMQAFRDSGGQSVIRAVCQGRRGNPVILPRALFHEVYTLRGDVGARHLVEREDIAVIDVELGEAAILDVDTPGSLRAAGGVPADPAHGHFTGPAKS